MNIRPLANLLRPRVGQDKRAALPVDLCNARSAFLLVAPGAREAEPVNVKAERGLNDTSRVGRGARTSLSYAIYPRMKTTSPCVLNSTAILDAIRSRDGEILL